MWRLSWIGVFLCFPYWAFAQSPVDIDTQFFRPATGQGFFAIEEARILGNFQLQMGALFSFADGSLVAFDNNGNVLFEPVAQQGVLDLSFALGLFDFAEIGVAFPLALVQNGDDLDLLGGGAGISGTSAGDLRLTGKARILGSPRDTEGIFLSFAPELSLPTGDGTQFFGTISPSVLLALAAEWRVSRVALGVNAGPRFQQEAVLDNLVVGNALFYGAGASVELFKKTKALAEVEGALSLEENGQNPLEARAGVKIALPAGFSLPIGAGIGLNQQLGSPDFRLFAGVAFSLAQEEKDLDEDGIFGSDDQCPNTPEDIDGIEDSDGCPEDNDQDGVADADDICPSVAGPAELFGCPDQDGDGVADRQDACPDIPGPEETKGCPDQDLDGVFDENDQCPTEQEDKDGFEDEDGCPDPDNDGDEILDIDDLCPDEAETVNGTKDDDGCPEDFGDNTDPTPTPTVSAGSMLGVVYFNTGQSKIKRSEFDSLDAVVSKLQSDSSLTVRLEGHADEVGSKIENQKLSERRSNRVYKYLTSKGVDASRIEVVGYGENKPAVVAANRESRSQNRRVEVVVVE